MRELICCRSELGCIVALSRIFVSRDGQVLGAFTRYTDVTERSRLAKPDNSVLRASYAASARVTRELLRIGYSAVLCGVWVSALGMNGWVGGHVGLDRACETNANARPHKDNATISYPYR